MGVITAEQAVLQRLAAGPVHPLARMAAGQADQSLEQTVGAHPAFGNDFLGPGQRLWTDVLSWRTGASPYPSASMQGGVAGAGGALPSRLASYAA